MWVIFHGEIYRESPGAKFREKNVREKSTGFIFPGRVNFSRKKYMGATSRGEFSGRISGRCFGEIVQGLIFL